MLLIFQTAWITSMTVWPPQPQSAVSVEQAPSGTAAAPVEEVVKTDHRPEFREGDDLIREDDYHGALAVYLELAAGQTEQLPVRMLYRLGICYEETGDFESALSRYRLMADRSSSGLIRDLSRVCQARVWLKLRQPEKTRADLSGMILASGASKHPDHPVNAEAACLFAIACSEIDGATDVIDPAQPWIVSPPRSWSAVNTLNWISPEAVNPAAESEPRRLVQVSLDDSPSALSKPIELQQPEGSVASALEMLAGKLGRTVSVAPDATATVNEREVVVDTRDVPASVILAALTSPYGLSWSDVGQSLVVFVSQEPEQEAEQATGPAAGQGGNADQAVASSRLSRLVARDALTSALVRYPSHRLGLSARLELGNLLYKDSQYSQAAVYYRDLVTSASNPLSIAASFNLGVASRALDRLDVARGALYRVVDGAPEDRLSAVASFLIGRMLLDEGRYEEAVAPLDAAARARMVDMESRGAAAVYAAIAHLLKDSYRQAGDVLFENARGLENESHLRDAAAFLNSYTRFLTMRPGSQDRRRETVTLIRSLFALGMQPDWMGSYGVLLVGRAYRDLGMTAQMSQLFERAEPHALGITRAEMQYWLLDAQAGTDEVPASVLDELRQFSIAEFSNRWGQRARLKLAELDLQQQRLDECLAECRQLLQLEDVERFAVLRLMGRAYERQGEQRRAAICFAGQIPPP